MKTSRSVEVSLGGKNSAQWVLLSDGAGPTEDIYFMKSAAPLLARHHGDRTQRIDTRRRWIPKAMRLDAVRGAHVLICRSLAPTWITFLERHRKSLERVTYLVDDDFEAGALTEGLPPAYLERLTDIVNQQWPRLLNLADELVVTSRALMSRFTHAHQQVSLLEPPMLLPPPDQTHFDQESMTLCFHGTRAHAADLDGIAPALKRFLRLHEQAKFLSVLGRFTPAALRDLQRVRCIEPMPWERFSRFMRRQRIHIGLVPLFNTPFNRCKSHVKFHEIASMGGVGVYSRREPYVDIVEPGVDGLLVDDEPEAWLEALNDLMAEPGRVKQMAFAASEKAARIGDPGVAARFWNSRH